MPQTAQEINEVFEVANLIKRSLAHSWKHTTIIADDSYTVNGELITNFDRRTWAVRLVPGFYLTIRHGLTVTWKSNQKYLGKRWYETVLMTGSPDFETLRTMKRSRFIQLRQRLFDIQYELVVFRIKMEEMGELGFGRAIDIVR